MREQFPYHRLSVMYPEHIILAQVALSHWSRDLNFNYGRDDSLVVHQHFRSLFEEARRPFNVREP